MAAKKTRGRFPSATREKALGMLGTKSAKAVSDEMGISYPTILYWAKKSGTKLGKRRRRRGGKTASAAPASGGSNRVAEAFVHVVQMNLSGAELSTLNRLIQAYARH